MREANYGCNTGITGHCLCRLLLRSCCARRRSRSRSTEGRCEFFRLARSQKAELNQYLTFTEPVTVNLEGKVYRFEQANP